MDPYIGEIRIIGFTYAPVGWALCLGQTMSIQQNSALFALLGVQYGGDGTTTFCLPNLSGRFPLGTGSTGGLTPRAAAQTGGFESVSLLASQMPAHSHGLAASGGQQTTNRPAGAYPAAGGVYAGSADSYMAAGAVAPSGQSQAHDNMPPFLALNFIIALNGVWPSRP